MERLSAFLILSLFIGSALSIHHVNMMKRHDNNFIPEHQVVRRAEGPDMYMYGALNVTATYYVSIQLGSKKQTFTVIADTGSSVLAVPNKDCSQYKLEGNELENLDKKCPHVNNFYDSSLSSDSSDVKPKDFPCQQTDKNGVCVFQLAYGDGSFLVGNLVEDDIYLADLTTKVVFGQIWAESENFGAGTDGIMGLAYQALDPNNGDSVFEQLAAAGVVENSFSMCLGYDGGVLQLGGMDSQFNAEEPRYTPLLEELYYVVNMTDVKVGGQSLGLPSSVYNQNYTIVDSGTTLMVLTQEAFDSMVQIFQTNICPDLPPSIQQLCTPDSQGNSLFTGCYGLTQEQILLFPDIDIVLNQVGSLPIGPEDYFLHVSQGSQSGYCFGIQPMEGIGCILGDVFMQRYNIHFDRANKRVGFAEVANCTGFKVALESVSGNKQKGQVNKEIEEPLVVSVMYENGQPAVGFVVEFKVTKGEGTFFNTQVVIGQDGKASNTFTPSSSGTVEVKAFLVGNDAVSTQFSFSVKMDPMIIIILGVVGGIAAIAIIAGIIFVVIRSRRKHTGYEKISS